jgi:para-aminobenzoate synthetase component 1
MTGAPKIKAMQLIDEFEDAKRNLFSGAIGWTDENGDFDFNVVIRHIFYDAESKKLCAWAGSAVTYDALPENEYEECLLKLSLIKSVLS